MNALRPFALLFGSLLLAALLHPSPAASQSPRFRLKPRNTAESQLNQWFQRLKLRVESTQRLLKKAKKPQKFALYLLLAQDYEQIIRVHRLLVKRYDTYRGRSDWRKWAKLRFQAAKQARLFRVTVAQIYHRLLNQYPKHPKLCQVYHGLGRQLLALHQSAAALTVYRGLLKAYNNKSCRHKADAHLAIAEEHFKRRRYSQALPSYAKAATFKTHPMYAFALYKLGWCHGHKKQYKPALAAYTQGLHHLRTAPSSQQPQDPARLAAELRKEFLTAFGHAGDPTKAEALFRKLIPLHVEPSMRGLVRFYKKQKKHMSAIVLLRVLRHQAGLGLRSLLDQYALLRHAMELRSAAVVNKELALLLGWLKTMAKNRKDAAFRRLYRRIQQAVGTLGKQAHGKRRYGHAIAVYTRLLGAWGSQPAFQIYLFWNAEALFASGQYVRAASFYQTYAQRAPRGRYAKDAMFNVLLSFLRIVKGRLRTATRGRVGASKGKILLIPHTAYVKPLLAACQRFLKAHPRDQRAPGVYFQCAVVAAGYQQPRRAKAWLEELLKRYPRHRYRGQAASFLQRLSAAKAPASRPSSRPTSRPGLGRAAPGKASSRRRAATRPTSRGASPKPRGQPHPTTQPASRPRK